MVEFFDFDSNFGSQFYSPFLAWLCLGSWKSFFCRPGRLPGEEVLIVHPPFPPLPVCCCKVSDTDAKMSGHRETGTLFRRIIARRRMRVLAQGEEGDCCDRQNAQTPRQICKHCGAQTEKAFSFIGRDAPGWKNRTQGASVRPAFSGQGLSVKTGFWLAEADGGSKPTLGWRGGKLN